MVNADEGYTVGAAKKSRPALGTRGASASGGGAEGAAWAKTQGQAWAWHGRCSPVPPRTELTTQRMRHDACQCLGQTHAGLGLPHSYGRRLEHIQRGPGGTWPLGDLHRGKDNQGAHSQGTYTSGRLKLEKICLMMPC